MKKHVVAIILAGGIGKRMGGEHPKQFITINKKPIIAYTLENFQKNTLIDDILIVCVKEYINRLQNIINKYSLSKVKWIVPGGETGHDSTRNGVFFLKTILSKTDFVVIHDAARPVLPQKTINDLLSIAFDKGNASCAIPIHETMILTNDGISGDEQLDRSKVMRVQTPQAYNYGMALSMYEHSERENRHDFVYADILAIHCGYKVFFSVGFSNNIKITTKEDLAIFKALLKFSNDELTY
jgi:2-C-methyl-D-erythritol 4-phosphate cytidylyltransferase